MRRILAYASRAAETVEGVLGLAEYSYAFVLRYFLPILREFGDVEVLHDLNAVDPSRLCSDDLLLLFTAPHHVPEPLLDHAIVVVAWEFEGIPDEPWGGDWRNDWVAVLDRCRGVITHSESTARQLRAVLSPRVPIVVIPAPVWNRFQAVSTPDRSAHRTVHFSGAMLDSAAGAEPHQSHDPVSVALSGVVFTSVFSPSDSRKRWSDMLATFVHVFRDQSDATLILKFIARPGSDVVESASRLLTRLGPFVCRVVLIHAHLSNSQYRRLISASDYVVNASNGEGQCLPLMEFMSAGIPAVAPAHTAMADYATDDNAMLVGHTRAWTHWPHDPRQLKRCVSHPVLIESLMEQFSRAHRVALDEPDRWQRMSRAAQVSLEGFCSARVARTRLEAFLRGLSDVSSVSRPLGTLRVVGRTVSSHDLVDHAGNVASRIGLQVAADDWHGEPRRWELNSIAENSPPAVGFYEFEEWGAWTRTSNPFVILPVRLAGDILVALEVCAFGVNIGREITVTVGGASARFSAPAQRTEIALRFEGCRPNSVIELSGIEVAASGLPDDPRSLGLGVSAITVRSLGRSERTLEVGEHRWRIDAAIDPEREDTPLLVGFHRAEPDHAWSRDAECSVVLPRAMLGNVEIEIECRAFGDNVARPLSVSAGSLEGDLTASHEFATRRFVGHISSPTTEIRIGGLTGEPTAGELDRRSLGIALRTVTVRRTGPRTRLSIPRHLVRRRVAHSEPVRHSEIPVPSLVLAYEASITDPHHTLEHVITSFTSALRWSRHTTLLIGNRDLSTGAYFSRCVHTLHRVGAIRPEVILCEGPLSSVRSSGRTRIVIIAAAPGSPASDRQPVPNAVCIHIRRRPRWAIGLAGDPLELIPEVDSAALTSMFTHLDQSHEVWQ